ncbi:D-alanyl-D-alanine carboxypeptidase [Streptomyces sp. NPDC021225]|uniref:D-alanyl-D-alanine carboxypeptidase n=1 Tax=Streptomyces sp. NPDC021225 TaxID=3365121 RepID=UPI0037A542AC
MAGESPDKSEQQKSSGETTRGEHDPRLAVFREGEAEGGGSAVAVVDEDPKAGVKAEPEAEPDAEPSVRESESGESVKSGKSDKSDESKDESDEDSDEEPSGEPVDRRTTVLGTLKTEPADGDGDGAKADDEDPATPVDRPTAAFRTMKTEPADGEGPKAADEDSAAPVDRPTAAFRTMKTEPTDGESAKADDEDSVTPVDRPTAAFGLLRQKEAPRWAQSGDKGDKGDKAEKAEESAEKAADAKPAEDKAKADDKAEDKPAEKPEGASERTSRFVPLRSTDDVPAVRPPARPSAPPLPESERTKQQPLPESERTKQQPLPPVGQPAPIDLLAQLTNTPPPPETPLRTAVRRVKIWTPLAVLLIIVLGVAQAMRPLPAPELKVAEAGYTFEGDKLSLPWPDQGQSAVEVADVGSLGTSGAQKPVPIASVTKVMTAYIVLKDRPLKTSQPGPSIKIDAQAGKEANSQDESRVPVEEGQTFTERQMLEMLLIPSGNNIARLLARWDAGSEEAFVKKMNDAAKDLGMKNTVYTDPSGFKATTKSTASDQLKLARAVMRSKAFREIVATPNIKIPGLKNVIYNNNNLLVKPGVIGIKTGSSTPAGGALMWGAERTIDGKKRLILGVVLEQRAPGILQNSLDLVQANSYKLISAVQDGLTSATVAKKGEVVGHIDDGLGGTTPVVATKDLTVVGWGGFEAELELTGEAGKSLPHSAKAGTVVGELSVGSGENRAKVPVALKADLSEPSLGSKLVRIA